MRYPFSLKFRGAAVATAASFFFASTLTFAQEAQPVAPPDDQQQQAAPEAQAPAPDPNQAGDQQAPPPAAPAPQAAPGQNGSSSNMNGPVAYPPQQGPAPQWNQAPYSGPGANTNSGPAYPQPGPYPAYGQQAPYPAYGQQQYPSGNYQQPYPQQAPPPIPAQLTIAPGTYVTVRINQMLSSDKSHQGDPFTATLIDPVVVNGVVVAEPGQTIGGVVADIQKGDPAKLLVRLTDLTLVDGQQIPVNTSLVARRGPGFNGRDAGTVVGTTAIGAAVGGAVGWGTGAAIGAGAGLLLGAIVTHHHPSVIYPEQVLTFRIENSATFSTQGATQAFHYIEPGEYSQYNNGPAPGPAPGYAYAAAPPAPYYYGYPYYPYWWGPTFGFAYWGGPHYYWHGPVVGGRVVVRR